MADVARFKHPLLDQVRAYALMQEDLERKHHGRWVIISGGQLRGDYKTYREAAAAPSSQPRSDQRRSSLQPSRSLRSSSSCSSRTRASALSRAACSACRAACSESARACSASKLRRYSPLPGS